MSEIERNVRIINEDDENKGKEDPVKWEMKSLHPGVWTKQNFVVGVDHAGNPIQAVMDSAGNVTMSGVFGVSGIRDVKLPSVTVTDDAKPRHMPNLAPVKKEELRYGNLVHIAQDWDYATPDPHVPTSWSYNRIITSFDDNEVKTNVMKKEDYDYSEYADVMAVPINDERLTKLGFEKKKGEAYWIDPRGKFKFHFLRSAFDSKSYIVCIVDKNLPLLENTIKYIHELQNVYYTFTGQDLDVTPLEND